MIEMAEKQTAADISNMPLQVTVSGERSLEADEQDPQPELSWWALTKMAAIWFGCSAVTNLLFFEAVPSQLRALVGEDAKTAALTVTVIVTATIILIISPVVGCLSDACDSSLGRRRPFMIAGALLGLVCIMLQGLASDTLPLEAGKGISDGNCSNYTSVYDPQSLAEDESAGQHESRLVFLHNPMFAFFLVSHVFLAIALVLIEVPFNGLVADLVPESQRGRASGAIGVGSILGSIAGSGIGVFYRELGVLGAFGIAGGFLLVFVLFGCFLEEPPRSAKAMATARQTVNGRNICYAFVKPFKSGNFCWLFFTRFLMMMGIQTIGAFMEFWLVDVVDKPAGISAERGVAILIAMLVIASLPSSWLGGWISDRTGARRGMVFFGGALVAIASLFYANISDYFVIIGFTVLAGIGFGVYTSLDFALALDVLHGSSTLALDLAAWHQAEVMPRLIAPPLAAAIVDAFRGLTGCPETWVHMTSACELQCTLGWTVLWYVVAGYFVLASVFIFRIKL